MGSRCIIVLVLMVLLFPGSSVMAASQEKVSTLADQKEVAVTIYNENLALVKDRRTIVLPAGESVLAFREVSGMMRPETALLQNSSEQNGLVVIEQNFDFDLLTPQKLLEKYVGKKIGVVKTHPTTGEETVEDATVLSSNNGVVLRVGDRIETGFSGGRLIFPDVPDNLRDKPTLVMQLASRKESAQDLELSYLTGGLNWQADYVAELNSAESRLNLLGWVTLTNTSGTSYKNARLQLVAGDVHQVQPIFEKKYREQAVDIAYAAEAPRMAEESLLDYHLYTLDRKTNILENQTKQVSLLQADNIASSKEYLLKGQDYYYRNRAGDLGTRIKVAVYLSFENTKHENLGLPLPKGIVRVYKQDSSGAVQFVGEDRIDHTSENETVRLMLGYAFDITADRKQTDFKKLAGFGEYNYVFESAYRIELKNGTDEEVVVRIVEPMPGDWQIISENQPHKKISSSEAEWFITIPAKGSAELLYRANVRF
ncbi:MAG: DUF4139 domain-containing protein [Deltaproteobacteria bacterium]|jgi:hypothetical protein|nr:DUF4139 domain-containing protein [Deltaproteobacteria bacterium]